VQSTSRLGCQVKLDASMDGLVIHIPKESRNLR
jgi:ferredoxin